MILENKYFVTMNHKKIRRLMHKFNLKATIRQAKVTHEHKAVPNHLNRNLTKENRGKFSLQILLTFILVLDNQLTFLVSKTLLHEKSSLFTI